MATAMRKGLRVGLKILAIDDDALALASLKSVFEDQGIPIQLARTGEQGFELFRASPKSYPVVLLDYDLSKKRRSDSSPCDPETDPFAYGNFIALKMRQIESSVRIIILSGSDSSEIIEDCLKAGADEFIIKQDHFESLSVLVSSVMGYLMDDQVVDSGTDEERSAKIKKVLRMVGRSREMAKVADLVQKYAAHDLPILIRGESGVGKEAIAKATHENSHRKSRPFIAVNCAAVPREILESELFGHERGSFTGALNKKIGLFEQAHGGTVFLDEIGDMPVELQPKILRALQNKEIQPVGGVPKRVDFRIVAATHRDLEAECRVARFREDLFYRLKVLTIEVAPLRERPEDIEPLVLHFINEMQEKVGQKKRIQASTMRKLKGHNWPGNVRDLEATVKKAFVLSEDNITPADIDSDVAAAGKVTAELNGLQTNLSSMRYGEFESSVNAIEKILIEQAFEKARGVKSVAASILGMSPNSLTYRLAALGMEKPARKK